MKFVELLEDKLKRTLGLNLQALGSNTIKNAISRRMRSLQIKNLEDYYNIVCRKKSEINELIDEISINETWFFRDNAPFSALHKYAQNWFKKGVGTTLRMLSIPCSTGEEPYSMAISMLEIGIDSALFSIDAIDINNRALAHAKRGIYSKRSFRGSNQVLQNQYFKKTKAGYAIAKEVKRSVKFWQGNLLEMKPLIPGFKYDIIFCRNLLIYLDKTHQKHAIAKLDTFLAPEGVLFTGHAEPGTFAGSNFIQSPYPKAFALTKKTTKANNDQQPNYPKEDYGKFQIPSEEIPNLISPDLLTIQNEAKEQHYEKAIALAENYLRKNHPSSHIFLLMAKIFLEMGDLRQAAKMLKKAIYLDPDSLEAINLLAKIYKQQGDLANCRAFELRSQRVTMRLATKKTR